VPTAVQYSKEESKKIWGRLWAMIRKYWVWMAIAIFAAAVFSSVFPGTVTTTSLSVSTSVLYQRY
jgi:uncharacterized protein involved in exopolysaccharide biosynthesis